MGYLKGLTSKDITVSPLTVHKTFSYSGQVPFSITKGQPAMFRAFPRGDGEGLGFFKSIRQLYYGNYVDTTDGKIRDVNLPEYNSDGTVTGLVRNNIYENNISSIEELRYYDSTINSSYEYYILSIPRHQTGDYIKPGSFSADVVASGAINGTVIDDGEGNIYDSNSNTWRGNIIYSAGLIIFTDVGGEGYSIFLLSNPSWKSSYTIYETQYKCTIGASELNYSLNPSLLKENGSNHILESGSVEYQDFVTGSYFNPYVTTVGLYNDDKELLAVGKLAQPLPLSKEIDTTILINIDR